MLLRLSCSSPEEEGRKEKREGRKGERRRRKKERKGEERRGKERKGEERRERRKGEALQIMIYTLGGQSPPSPPLPLSPPSSSYQKFSENVGRHYTPHPSSSLPSYSILLLLLSLPPSHLHPTLPPSLPFPPPLTSNALNMFADTPLATSYSPCSLGFRSIIEQNILRQKQKQKHKNTSLT